MLTAQTAHELGFVAEVCRPEELEDVAMAKANRIAALHPLAAQMIKRQINEAQDAMGFRTAISAGHSAYMIANLGHVFFDRENPFGSRKKMPWVDEAKDRSGQDE